MKIKTLTIIGAHMLLLSKTYGQFIVQQSGGSTPNTTNLLTNGYVGIGIPTNVAPTAPLQVKYPSTNTQVAKIGDNVRYIGIGRDEVAAFDASTGASANMYLGGDGTNPTKLALLTSGYVGIGTTNPSTRLEVAGQVKITGGTPGAGKVLTSDASGLASWTTITGLLSGGANNYIPKWSSASGLGNSQIYDNGNVGIGTSIPKEHLQIGDRFVFHDGGNKYLGYNISYDIPNGVNKTIVANDYASAITFGNGDFTFITAPLTAAANTVITPTAKMIIKNTGEVGIGDTYIPAGYKLAVKGKIIAEEVLIQLRASWPDYVFNKKYELASLDEVEGFIKKNHHLNGFETACDYEKNGISTSEIIVKQQQKLEELTLYIIELDKKIKELEKK
jgi:hypothetical protein